MDDRERSELLERLSEEFSTLISIDLGVQPKPPKYNGKPLAPEHRQWSKVIFTGFSPNCPDDLTDSRFTDGWASRICGLRSDGRYFIVGVYLIDGFDFEDPEKTIRQFLQDGWEYFDSYRCCSCGKIAENKNSPCLLHGDDKATIQ